MSFGVYLLFDSGGDPSFLGQLLAPLAGNAFLMAGLVLVTNPAETSEPEWLGRQDPQSGAD